MTQRGARRVIERVVQLYAQNRDAIVLSGVASGLKFNSGPASAAYALGRNERPVQEALATYLQPGDVFYDVGANVGFFTIVGAKLVGTAGRVYAFEPVAANAGQVHHNAAINGFEHVQSFRSIRSTLDRISDTR